MAHFLQDRSCNDDFMPLPNPNPNMDVQEASFDLEINQLIEQVEGINLNTDKRKREYVDAYIEATTVTVSHPHIAYNFDEDAIIEDDSMELENNGYISQGDDDEVEDDEDFDEDFDGDFDEDLFQRKHQLPAYDMNMDLSDSEEDVINEDFDELQRLRDEVESLRAELRQRRIAFPEGSIIRFIMVDGVRYLEVFQYAPPAPPLTIDDLNCDSDDDL